MTIEERHEALLDDIRKLMKSSETSAEACKRHIRNCTPMDSYFRLELSKMEENIAVYRKLLKDDWERGYDLS